MRREGGAQGREGVRRGKGEGVGEGGTGLSDWFKRTCQASGHPAGLRGMVAKCSLAPKAMKAAKAMSCLRQPLGAVVSTEDTPQEELPLHLDACHSCAMREVGIDDDGSDFSEGYLHKRYRAYHAQVDGRIPPQRAFRYGLNELGGKECSLCGPDGVYQGSARSRSPRRNHSTTHPQEMNDHHLLRKMLEDVEPGWEGHVLAGNCEYAKGEGDPDKINAANRLYALWERQGTESREDLSCDTEHAESEEEEQEKEDNEIVRRSIVERLFKNVSWDTLSHDARANLYYYALDHGLLAETLEEQERQGTASGQDGPVHGLGQDTPCALEGCTRPRQYEVGCAWDRCCKECFKTDGREHERGCDLRFKKQEYVRPHMQEHHYSSPIPPESASPFPIKFKPMRGAVVDLDGETQTVIGGKPELSDVATQTVIGLIPTPRLFNIDASDAPMYISRREAEILGKRKRSRVEAT